MKHFERLNFPSANKHLEFLSTHSLSGSPIKIFFPDYVVQCQVLYKSFFQICWLPGRLEFAGCLGDWNFFQLAGCLGDWETGKFVGDKV